MPDPNKAPVDKPAADDKAPVDNKPVGEDKTKAPVLASEKTAELPVADAKGHAPEAASGNSEVYVWKSFTVHQANRDSSKVVEIDFLPNRVVPISNDQLALLRKQGMLSNRLKLGFLGYDPEPPANNGA